MKKSSLAAGFVVMATAGLAASAVIATAQPAPPAQTRGPVDDGMDPMQALKQLDDAPTPSRTGDDKAACDKAAEAQARFEAGISTARERSRAFEHAKSLAASGAMRRAIDGGFVPACPPAIDPEVRS